MKPKDIAVLIVSVIIFLVAGYIAYTQLVPHKNSASDGTEVEIVGVIPTTLDQSELDRLLDTSITNDFTPVMDLNSGLGNNAPFGQ
jgi:hypothetical protein